MKKLTLHILPIRSFTADILPSFNPDVGGAILCSSYQERLDEAGNRANMLCLYFQDTAVPDGCEAFCMEQAEQVKSFLGEMPLSVTDLYICCDSAQSRSPAIAAAILRVSGRSDAPVWLNPYYVPNPLVYRYMCKSFGLFAPRFLIRFKCRQNKRAFRITQKRNGMPTHAAFDILK